MMAFAWIGYFSHHEWAHLVTALLHTLWQGALIAGLLYAFLRLAPARRTGLRYAAAGAALLLTVLAGATTWGILEYGTKPMQEAPARAVLARPMARPVEAIARPEAVSEPPPHLSESPRGAGPNGWAALAASVWLAGVFAMLCRAFLLVSGAGRLNRRCRPADDEALTILVRRLSQAMGIGRDVRVAVGHRINGPAVLGFIWPTVLLPTAMVSGLPPEQLRLILAHELAHLRRHDYLVNVMQMLIEALLFFNPSTWWISRQMRIEREACCDAAAVAATGRPHDYVRALADWVERARTAAHQGASVGLAGGDSPGSLLDRVKRVVISGYQPSIRAGWYTVAALMLGATAALAVALLGTGAAAGAAAQLLSPRERVERLIQIEQTYGPREYGEADNILVSGSVRTEDGEPIPGDAYMWIRSQRPHTGYAMGLDLREGEFSHRVEFGAIEVMAWADGYAPAFAGPLEAEPGGRVLGIELVLRRGFTGRLVILGQNDQPVENAEVHGSYVRGNSYVAQFSTATSAEGVAVIEHCADNPVRLNVTANGYQFDQRQLTLSPERPITWQLRPTKPATGVVISEVTGEPIAGAELLLLRRTGPFAMGHDPKAAPVLATTDTQGRFALTTLPDGTDHDLLVQAEGYGRAFVLAVQAGQTGLKVKLGPELYVHGRIIGPLDKLRKQGRQPYISYSNPYTTSDGANVTRWHRATVEIRQGEGRFEIADLWPGRLEIRGGSKRMNLDLTAPVEDLVIDLREEEARLQSRPVIVRIQMPEGAPQAQGALEIQGFPNAGKGLFVQPVLEDGQVRFDMPVPGRLSVLSLNLVGCWFEDTRHARVEPGEEPFIMTIPATPAGAIYGRVLNADGTSAGDALFTVAVAKKAPAMDRPSLELRRELRLPGARFNAGPLPLGGTYVLVAWRGHAFAVSQPVALDEETPFREVDLAFVEGVTVPVQVLDPQGVPVPNAEVGLDYDAPYSHGFSGPNLSTDRHGRVAFEHVNPDAPGHYTLSLPFRRSYQPVVSRIRPDGRPLTIRLKEGKGLQGVVIDAATGWPVPGVEVFARPVDFKPDQMPYRWNVEGLTDAHGEFRFSNLSDREYRLTVSKARLAGPSRGVLITPGQAKKVEILIEIPEWSRLKAAQP